MKQYSAIVIIITIVIVTDLASSECHNQEVTGYVDFEVKCSSLVNYNVEIFCHSENWTKFPDAKLDMSSASEISFKNCSFSASINVQNILHSMKIKDNRKIVLQELQSTLNRENFKDLAATQLSLLSSNFSALPFDLFYDVVNVDTFQISETQLTRIPEGFFSNWAKNISLLNMKHDKLQKIASNDFSELVHVTFIDLSYNEIYEIEPEAFDRLVRLENLHLRSNRLRTLSSGIFHKLARIETLDLGMNPFDKLPRDLFANTKNLVVFNMHASNGTLSTLPHGFFKNLTHLESVNLANNRLESLPSDLFAGCSQINEIVLDNNRLKSLSPGLFNDTKNLITLEMNRNHLETLPAGIFKGLHHLKQLSIISNRLTSLMADVLKDLQSIDTFSAVSNNLTQIDNHFLTYFKSATVIDLTNNQLTFESLDIKNPFEYQHSSSSIIRPNKTLTSTFENLTFQQMKNVDASIKFKKIHLGNNSITRLNAQIINIFMHSEYVDLRNNQISEINLSNMSLGTITRNITNRRGKVTTGYLKVYLQKNPLHCDCKLMDFARYLHGWKGNELYNIFDEDGEFTCASPSEFAQEDLRDIRLEELNCPLRTNDSNDACNQICVCRRYPEKRVLSVDCSNRNLTHIPSTIGNMHNFSIELNMTGNMVQYSPSLSESYLMNVTSLDLSNNNITKVTLDLFSAKLQQLRLHGNSISRLDSNIIEHLERSNLNNITLYDNKWICDCEARQLLDFIQKKFTRFNFHGLKCYGTNQKIYKMTVSDLCKYEIMIIVIASLSFAFLGIVIASLVVFYYKYQREIKFWLYSKQWCLWFVTEDELDKDQEYDAFISFSHKDEDFVEKEIVAKLERGPRPYKLCLHYRDWLAGEWIPVQISRSVAQSRRTIVILTPNFLESVWGLIEFRAAHTQALKEGRARLIVIIYGDIGNINDLDQEMQDYLRLNTYIKWGDPWFWDKLKYALPHTSDFSKRHSRNPAVTKNHSIIFSLANGTETNIISEHGNFPNPKYKFSTNDSEKLLNPDAERENKITSYL